MIWLWYLLTAYLLCSYAMLGVILVVCPIGNDEWQRIQPALRQAPYWAKGFLLATLGLAALVLGPCIPVVMVSTLWKCRQEERFWRQFRRQFREAEMEPIALSSVHPAGRKQIHHYEGQIVALGFRLINTYLYKPQPFLIQLQCYLSEDTRTILSLGHIDGEPFYSLTSILSDGAAVETSVSGHPIDVGAINETGCYYAQMFHSDEGEDVASIHILHESMLDRLERDLGPTAIAIGKSSVRIAMKHANLRFAQAQKQLGWLDNDPPQPQWPWPESIASHSVIEPQESDALVLA